MASGLEGITIIDLTQGAAGPIATRLIADFGADIIHIEPRIKGDWVRSCMSGAMAAESQQCEYNYVWENYDRNKRSLSLDLSQDSGREIIHKLAEKADVFATNIRPREMKKFDVEYDTLSRINPRIIYASLTGYGTEGPERNDPVYDATGFWARSGMYETLRAGGDPPYCSAAAGDNISGLSYAYGILLALLIRERTGVGQKIETSLLSTAVFTLSWEIAGALATGQNPSPQPRELRTNPVANTYPTKDNRWLGICLLSPEVYWSRFCKTIEREDLEHDPRFGSLDNIRQNHRALFTILNEEVFPSKTLAEWKQCFAESNLPWSPVQSLTEVTSDPQAIANDLFINFEHPTYGPMKEVANPARLSKTPGTIRMPAPEFGQHTEEVLLELGYTWENIEKFKEQGVID